jgi:hypothetical protein
VKNFKNDPLFKAAALDICAALLALSAKPLSLFMMRIFPDCYFAKFGILCPSCGGTRAVMNLFSGNFSAAWRYNAFFCIVVIFLVFLIAILNAEMIFGAKWAKKIRQILCKPQTAVAFAVFYVVFGVVRNSV